MVHKDGKEQEVRDDGTDEDERQGDVELATDHAEQGGVDLVKVEGEHVEEARGDGGIGVQRYRRVVLIR